jgi:hypothetical protein
LCPQHNTHYTCIHWLVQRFGAPDFVSWNVPDHQGGARVWGRPSQAFFLPRSSMTDLKCSYLILNNQDISTPIKKKKARTRGITPHQNHTCVRHDVVIEVCAASETFAPCWKTQKKKKRSVCVYGVGPNINMETIVSSPIMPQHVWMSW